MQPRGLSNTMLALVYLQAVKPYPRSADLLFAACAEALVELAGDPGPPRKRFNAQDISNSAWSLAKFQSSAAPHAGGGSQLAAAMTALCAEAKRLDPADFSPQSVANLAWAQGTTGVVDAELLRLLAATAAAAPERFKPQEVSNLAWAFARAALPAEPTQRRLFAALAVEARERLPALSIQHLSNIAWAFVTVSAEDLGLLRAVAAQAREKTSDFRLQELSNLAWAFATQPSPSVHALQHSSQEAALLVAIAAELERRLTGLPQQMPRAAAGAAAAAPEAVAEETAKNCIGTLWALNFAGALPAAVAALAREVLPKLGRQIDEAKTRDAAGKQQGSGRSRPPRGRSSSSSSSSNSTGTLQRPETALDLDDRMVLFKPDGWQVDQDKVDLAEGEGEAPRLSGFVREELLSPSRWPIAADSRHGCGFLHRLDVPCSGLIVVAKTYEAYYDLLVQLNLQTIARDYIVLCHGHMSPERWEICARLQWAEGTRLPSIVKADEGKPARTLLKVLAHGWRDCQPFTLVALRIVTGRRHQIRAHLAYIGHPTVCDAKYHQEGLPSFLADRRWCRRTFLHRYRVTLEDREKITHEVLQPLPPDLATALGEVKPAEASSERALQGWCSGHALADWKELVVLDASRAENKKGAVSRLVCFAFLGLEFTFLW
eukprot:TRINITY_DN28991_c0_g2_i5.p1 TRINITY_DN28991_c0_g2~~TRINITY_DN28991_c0_g2_i5.p1  ORF type:complete len:660 (-),score=155.85 TRINITY_DN28991_c0_g2_i5:61-2040(-)